MLSILGVLAVLTAGGVFLTERVDRPRRRNEQIAAQTPAE